jgi:molybdate-binding protein
LSRSRCDLAGFHVPIGKLAKSLWQHYAKWVRPQQQKIIRLVLRTQGLIVPKGNPQNIQAIADLARPGLRFVNRQATSGTRILLDGLVNAQATLTIAANTVAPTPPTKPKAGIGIRSSRHL